MLNFFVESFLLGLKNLRLHKLRSLLTALGIIIGVSAVIVMVAIGEGAKQAAQEQMEQLGATNVLVRSVRPPESNAASNRTQRMLEYGLTRADLERLKTLPHVSTIVPLRDTEQRVTVGDVRATANAIGATPDIFNIINLPIEPGRGRYFTKLEYERGADVCVIGATAARQLFPYHDPIGQKVQIGTSNVAVAIVEVVGVLQPTGLRAGSEGQALIGRDLDQDVYFPLTLAQAIFGETTVKRQSGGMESKRIELTEVWMQIDDVKNVERISAAAEYLVSSAHAGKVDYEVKAPIQILRNAERLNRIFNFIMGGVASLSLLVGGIGIMNIMLASVTERTREIGIRRALGAKQRHITLQFLIETTVISLTGGAIGVGIGIGGAWLLPVLVQLVSDQTYRTNIATWSVVGSFIVSAMIGIVFGLYPAIMAARMNPIEALRHE